jgi:thioredoxin reductase (NADPH)
MADTEYEFDFFVIGGGSGGLAAAKAASSLGAKVGLADFVQPSPAGTSYGLGGTCVNVGCIPKKLLHIAAQRAEILREAHQYGFAGPAHDQVEVNWNQLVQSINLYIRKLNWNYKSDLRTNKVTFFNSFATFADPHTLNLTAKNGDVTKVTAKYILIACGGRPSLGGYPGAEECCISSDDIFWRKTAPGKTLVVGASYIALECAGFLTGLGIDTTVMVRSILLRGFDTDIAEKIGSAMERRGVKFERGLVPSRFERDPSTSKVKVFIPSSGGDADTLFGEFDTVLMAVGRKGYANKLNLEAAGVVYNSATGKIIAGNDDKTNIDNIFAIGDVVEGRMELTPPAIFAGKLLADRLFCFSTTTLDYSNIATTVFTPVEYGCVGLSEEQATELIPFCTVYHKFIQPLDDALLENRPDNECYIKLITEPREGKVVGVHYLGPHAGEVIQGLAVAMKAGCTKEHLDNTIGIHPTNAEQFVGMSLTTVKEVGVELSAEGGGC